MVRSTEPTPSDAHGPDDEVRVPRGRRTRLLVLLVALAAVVLVVDQVVKQLAVTRLEPGEYVPIIGDLLGLSLVFNSGAAFSFAEGMTWVFTIAAVVVTGVIVAVSRRLGSKGWAVALGALLGGNLGNLGDRLFREPGFGVGHVVDMINYANLFVGNVADIAIVLSALAIALLTLRGVGVDGHRYAREGRAAHARGDAVTGDGAEATGTAGDAAGERAAGDDAAGDGARG